ncbi:MAG: response regulator [Bacteroidales bacterium]|nr:response regulator [Bacteroidales bacterium]
MKKHLNNNITILVAEDDIFSYVLIKEFLNETVSIILHAENGKQAIEIFKENVSVDLVLMDIKLPVINGLEAIREIKKIRNNIPIIIQSAYILSKEQKSILNSDRIDYLSKPFNKTELLDKINNYLPLS